MLDIKLVRQHPERLRRALSKRGLSVDVDELIEQDERRRSLIRRVDELRAERKRKSSEIFALGKQGVPTDSLKHEARRLAAEIKDAEADMSEADVRTKELLDALPNAPDDDVPAGGKDSNRIIREWGKKTSLDFDGRDHVELAEQSDADRLPSRYEVGWQRVLDVPRARCIDGVGTPELLYRTTRP